MQKESGFALMAVLFITALVSTLALGYATTARLKALQVRHGQEKVREVFRLASCLELGWHEYRKYNANKSLMSKREEVEAITGEPLNLWFPRFEPYLAEIDGNQYEIQLVKETGKFDLNKVSSEDLLQILQLCGADEADALAIADAMQDFVDSDDNHRLNGAEDDYYEKLTVPYACKNQFFENVEELLLVRGITPKLYFGSNESPGLVEMFSILGETSVLDVNNAPPSMFKIIEELPDEMVRAVVALRQKEPITDLADLSNIISYDFFTAFKNRFAVKSGAYLTITATRKYEDGRPGGHMSITHSLNADQQS